MNTAINKNKKWVTSLLESIELLSEQQKLFIMKHAGMECASDLLLICADHLGRQVDTIEDLVIGWNILRDSRNLKGKWQFENGVAHGIFYECGCPLIRSGLIDLHPVQCLCSKGMIEMVFSNVAKKRASVEIICSIGRGDNQCEFVVSF